MKPSSADLHPKSGARFTFESSGEGYAVAVHLPDGVTLETTLRFDAEGEAALRPPLENAWASEEVLKLARVLKRDPKPRLSRWRP
jgi:hypothetical protein